MSMNTIGVLILAGGMGTRLKPVMSGRPKALAPVAGRPFLSILLDQISRAGFSRVILCTGYMADQVEAEFGTKYKSLSLIYSREVTPLGTGGALRHALPLISSESIMVMNGDSFVDADLNAFLDWFVGKGCNAALLLTKMNDATRYGLVHVDPNGLITRFHEKGSECGPGWINAGIYLFKRSVVETIPQGRPFSLEREFFPSLAGRELYGYCSEGKFIDIGIPETYAESEEFFSNYMKYSNEDHCP
ncbi:MAG: nucleotidyltransferase family protein [Deltaproteobacteria bacterium]|nr:nucleotidyltransferase family protein [Deltaproteobacteria bacterium]